MKMEGSNSIARSDPGRVARAPGGPTLKRIGRVRLAASLAVVLSTGFLALAGPAGAAQNGEIAFTSDRDGYNEVYLTDADGAEPAVKVTGRTRTITPPRPLVSSRQLAAPGIGGAWYPSTLSATARPEAYLSRPGDNYHRCPGSHGREGRAPHFPGSSPGRRGASPILRRAGIMHPARGWRLPQMG